MRLKRISISWLSEGYLVKREDKKKCNGEIRGACKGNVSVDGNAIIEIATGAQTFNLTELGDVATKLRASCIEDATAHVKLHLEAAYRTLRSSDNKTVKRFIRLRTEVPFPVSLIGLQRARRFECCENIRDKSIHFSLSRGGAGCYE